MSRIVSGEVQRKKVMKRAAGSAILAPACRNSQKGVNKLLEAVAADYKGLQHCDVIILVSQPMDIKPGPMPTHPM